jgi:hypothetical protein
VYDLVSDITRMGEWSPECRNAIPEMDESAAETFAAFMCGARVGMADSTR